MGVSLAGWVITCALILGLFVFDFYAHVRVPHEPTFRESASWSAVPMSLRSAAMVWSEGEGGR